MDSDYYRQAIPALSLSIERGTSNAPADGKFYVIKQGEILASFRSLKQAQELFKKIVEQSGYRPEPTGKKKTSAELAADRYLDAKDLYWSESYKYRGGGGKGGRGGV